MESIFTTTRIRAKTNDTTMLLGHFHAIRFIQLDARNTALKLKD